MAYRQDLLERAETYWQNGQPVPTDLGAQMIEAGFDVTALEGHSIELGENDEQHN